VFPLRFSCHKYAKGNCLPVVRTMFHGHTLVECQADEATIMRLMSENEKNQGRMLEFLQRVERGCVPASLDCVPENASAITQQGVVQARGLLTVDSRHWTPELPERIGVYHAYIRGFNRDVRTHRLFIVCSGGMARASDAFCNMVIDGGRDWTAHVNQSLHFPVLQKGSWPDCPVAGHLRVPGGVVAPQGVPSRAVPAHQVAGGRVRHTRQIDSGKQLDFMVT